MGAAPRPAPHQARGTRTTSRGDERSSATSPNEPLRLVGIVRNHACSTHFAVSVIVSFPVRSMSTVPAPIHDTPAQHPLLGTTLRGTYRILRQLDQGGMGTVFDAEHVRLRRRVAVKVLAQHLAKDAHALARFNREAEIISQLQHPHVVQVTDFDTTEAGEPYLVMELLAGESLATRLERERCLPVLEAVSLAHQVSSGLAAA